MSKNNKNNVDMSKWIFIIIFLIIFGGPFAFVGIVMLVIYLVSKSKTKREEEEREEEEAIRREIEIDERVWTCKRCGANTKGRVCEYCDSPYGSK